MPSTETIAGLLIEGVDYSGKTSVATALAGFLRDRGVLTRGLACFVNAHPIIDRLLAIARESDRLEERDACYTASLLLDLTLPVLPASRSYLIQERHALTQIARNRFFYEDHDRWQIEEIERLRPRFSCQVYLWSDLAAKRVRTRSRPPKSPRDAMLAADRDRHQRYDDYMRSHLPADEQWLVVDTSPLTVANVAQRIVQHLEAADGERLRAHSFSSLA